MGWTERAFTFDEAGLGTWDSYSAANELSYSGTVDWAGGSPAEVFAALIAFPGPLRPSPIQFASGSTPDTGGFTTYDLDLDAPTKAGNFVVVDILFAGTTIVSGVRVSDNAGNFYWPLYCFRSVGGAGHLACFVGLQIAPASEIHITQGPGASSQIEYLSIIAGEYSGFGMAQPGALSFSGSCNGANNKLTVSTPTFSSWVDSCYCSIAGLGTVKVGYISSTQISLPSTPSAGAYDGVTAWPPDNMGGFSTPSEAIVTAVQGESVATLTVSETISSGAFLLHLVGGSWSYFPVSPPPSGGGEVGCSPAWLVINEPGTPNVWTDQSNRISQAEPISFSWIVKQRGSAKIPLYIPASDSYMPTIGSQVCLWDLTDEADFEVFSGTIDDFNVRWLGQNGDRIVTLTCVSLEQCFDTIRLPNLLFENTTAGAIFTALLAYASGAPVGTGTIDAGADIANFLITDFPSISDVFGRLATLSEYVWGVDPGTGNVYFTAPDITPAPFIVSEDDVLWEQMTLKEERHDFRNRQILKANANAAVQSSEYFVGVGQLNFTLLRPVDQVTAAWITQNIQNSATGTFSGQPNAGDTISFGYANSGGSGYTWLPSHTYAVGDIIIDPAGYVQKVTAQTGPTGGSEPTWLDIYGEVTIDHDVAWTNQGPAGFGSNIAAIYTFVTALDNTQFGQVLIGSDVAHTAQNLVDAINAIAAQSGVTFSLPTWENPIVNADEPAGLTTIVVRNKAAGAGFVAGLSSTGTHFSFNRSTTFGGVTTFGTITVNVGVQGQTIGGSGPTLVYTPGSADVSLATPLNSGSNLQVQYAAANAAYIIVEDTADVLERAVIEGGTGKYQQTSSDDSAVTMPAGLQLAQQQLAAYGVIPSTFEFTTFQAGLYTGQVLDVVLEIGAGDLVNTTLSPLSGQWFIQEINAESLPMYREEAGNPVYLPGPTGGHYRYTVRCIDVAQIGSWIDFWLGLSGGGGSASGSALFPGGGSIGGSSTSNLYSAAFTCVAGTPLAITHGLNTTAIIAQAYDSSGNLAGFGSLVVTDANTITVTFGIGFTGKIVVMG